MGDFIQLGDKPTPSKTPYTLNIISGIVVALMVAWYSYLVVTQYQALMDLPNSSKMYGRIGGALFGAVLWGMLFSYTAFRLGRRSLFLANFIFILVFFLIAAEGSLVLYNVSRFVPSQKLASASKELRQNNNKLIDQYMETGETSSSEHIAKTMEIMDGLSKGNTADAKVARIVGSMLNVIKPMSLQMEEATRNITSTDISQVETEQELDKYIADHQHFRKLTTDYVKQYKELPEQMKVLLKKENLNERDMTEFMTGFQANMRIKQHGEYRQTIIDYCLAMEELLTFLKEHWGEWEYEAANGVVFKEEVNADIKSRYENLSSNAVFMADKMAVSEEEWMKGLKQQEGPAQL